jgi:hypothetical protein
MVVIIVIGGSFVGVGLLVYLSGYFWRNGFDVDDRQADRSFERWVIQGLAPPMVLWLICNLGVIPGLPPLLPSVRELWFDERLTLSDALILTSPSLLVVGSCWAAVTVGWLLGWLWSAAQNRADLVGVSVFWCVLLTPVVWMVVALLGWSGIGFAALIWLVALAQAALPMVRRKARAPAYAPVIAKLKFGKYADAESALLQQLEICEDDVQGWMMLAELYAEHFHELPEADRLIRDLCRQPNTTSVQLSLALHRLADWHLKLGNDPLAARAALEELCLRLPGTHFDRMARQRIRQLPANRQELEEQRQPRVLHLPALSEGLDNPAALPEPQRSPEAAAARARQLVERLERNPDHVEAREELARLLAEELGQVDAALEQLRLLLGMPTGEGTKAPEWLALTAAWQLRLRHDEPRARQTLQRLIRDYPQAPQALAARRRLDLLDVEQWYRSGRPGRDRGQA